MLDFMLGAVMATTKKHLAEIGGFESLVDYFCDDYELGNRIAARGHRVELSRFPVAIVYPRETLARGFSPSASLESEHSLFAPLGPSRPDFHAGAALDVVGVSLAHSWLVAIADLSAALLSAALRSGARVGARGMARSISCRRKLWLLPLRDAFAFVVWLASFFPQRIHWRDQQFYVRDKRLVPIPPRQS